LIAFRLLGSARKEKTGGNPDRNRACPPISDFGIAEFSVEIRISLSIGTAQAVNPAGLTAKSVNFFRTTQLIWDFGFGIADWTRGQKSNVHKTAHIRAVSMRLRKILYLKAEQIEH
jgi:hypothetical protein